MAAERVNRNPARRRSDSTIRPRQYRRKTMSLVVAEWIVGESRDAGVLRELKG
jgi:hypothetical protein